MFLFLVAGLQQLLKLAGATVAVCVCLGLTHRQETCVPSKASALFQSESAAKTTPPKSERVS